MQDIKISADFKKQVARTIFFIVLFIITYLCLILLAVGLTVVCVFSGIYLIIAKPMFATIALGIGLASMGFIVLFFLFKFIFTERKVDRSHLLELKEADEPELFALIKDLTKEIGTKAPKRIYLSSEVNASVFYDSSFWSMFFPVKKNLLIGIGLINSVNKSELKAILSHEFGHFSQRSMKVGSYVYNVNQIIYNLLYKNDSYDKVVSSLANMSGYFTLFLILADKIMYLIKLILQAMYGLINKTYLRLSREMEFHADEIAAHTTGFEPLESSLLRLEFASNAFYSALAFYNEKSNLNYKSENIFRDQSFVMNFLARENDITIENDLPQLAKIELSKFNKSKLNVEDQWASHPSTEERISRLKSTGLHATTIDSTLAIYYLKNASKYLSEFNNRVFQDIGNENEKKSISFDQFRKDYKANAASKDFPKIFNKYYDSKNPAIIDLNETTEYQNQLLFDELFSDEMVDCVYTEIALINDIESIRSIANKTYNIKSFDYNGIKYRREDGFDLANKLETELNDLRERIGENDYKIFQFFSQLDHVKANNQEYKSLYSKFCKTDENYDLNFKLYQEISEHLDFLNVETKFELIDSKFKTFRTLEGKLKIAIQEIINNSEIKDEIHSDTLDNFERFLTQELIYFFNKNYIDSDLQILFTAIDDFLHLQSRNYFLAKKQLIEYQEFLLQ